MTKEKRNSPRDTRLTEVTFEHDGLSFGGRLSDLSAGGFYIDTINPLPDGTTITFRFSLPGLSQEEAVVGEGIVAWQKPFLGMGVRFTVLSDETKDKLIRYIQGGR